MVNAAYDLGATQWQMLREVMLPYLTPGIIAGYFMAFTYSLDDFAVTFFVTGNGFQHLLWKFTHVHVRGFLWKSMPCQLLFSYSLFF